MKNTKVEIQKEILSVQSEIRQMQKNLKNSKDYLIYLKECFEEEKEEFQTNEEGDILIVSCVRCGNDVSITYNGKCKNCK